MKRIGASLILTLALVVGTMLPFSAAASPEPTCCGAHCCCPLPRECTPPTPASSLLQPASTPLQSQEVSQSIKRKSLSLPASLWFAATPSARLMEIAPTNFLPIQTSERHAWLCCWIT